MNSFLFTVTMILILVIASKNLKILITPGTSLCFLGAVLLALSNALTSSWKLQFLNSVGTLLLLEVSLIRLFWAEKVKSLTDYLYNMFMLPIKTLSSVGMLFADTNRFVKEKKLIKNERLRNILTGCVIAIPILIIIITLLSGADMVFGRITRAMFEWFLYRDFYIILLLIILGTLLCYSLFCGASRESTITTHNKEKANPTIGITISTLLLIVYILFCTIQILYLFTGGLFTLPKEFTYSEYARQGFFELLAVTCLNIILILICVNVFAANKWLDAILTAITAGTYIMIASAGYRMLLYIEAYHLTFLRLFVLLFLLIDALLLIGIIISIYHKQFPLFGYSVIVISLCYMTFSFSKPDYYIAKYLISHKEEITNEDITFLTEELSYDAAPVVIPFLNEQYVNSTNSGFETYYERVADRAAKKDIRDYNYSYEKAYELIR